jgi:hypothetical protein
MAKLGFAIHEFLCAAEEEGAAELFANSAAGVQNLNP